MPGSNSFARIVADGQKLLAAVAANADQLKGAEALRTQLDQLLTQFKELAARRDTLKADKQVLSKQLAETAQRISDTTIDLKAGVKSALGSRSEKLVEFSVAPRRKVLRTERTTTRKAAKTPPAPATPSTPVAGDTPATK